jgi:hypothetical protein
VREREEERRRREKRKGKRKKKRRERKERERKGDRTGDRGAGRARAPVGRLAARCVERGRIGRWDDNWYWCRDGGSPGKVSGDSGRFKLSDETNFKIISKFIFSE